MSIFAYSVRLSAQYPTVVFFLSSETPAKVIVIVIVICYDNIRQIFDEGKGKLNERHMKP